MRKTHWLAFALVLTFLLVSTPFASAFGWGGCAGSGGQYSFGDWSWCWRAPAPQRVVHYYPPQGRVYVRQPVYIQSHGYVQQPVCPNGQCPAPGTVVQPPPSAVVPPAIPAEVVPVVPAQPIQSKPGKPIEVRPKQTPKVGLDTNGDTQFVSDGPAAGPQGVSISGIPITAEDLAAARRGDHSTLLKLHNAERAKARLGPLDYDAKLAGGAKAHAQFMANSGWLGSFHSYPFDLAKFGSQGENVGWMDVFDLTDPIQHKYWMDSDGHRNNILRKEWTKVGFGRAEGPNGTYYAAEFSR